jgi:phosphate starvation-inducible protein PhoH
MCLTRIGKEGKIIACGDSAQIDLRYRKDSGMDFLTSLCGKVNNYACIELKENHRDPIVDELLNHFEVFKSEIGLSKVA